MNRPFSVNKKLIKTLATMAKHWEESLQENNLCLKALRDTIQQANRNGLLTLKASLVAFVEWESRKGFDNKLLSLYLQLIEQHLDKK